MELPAPIAWFTFDGHTEDLSGKGWHATAASGTSERDFAAPFDTVNARVTARLAALRPLSR